MEQAIEQDCFGKRIHSIPKDYNSIIIIIKYVVK